MLYYFEIKFFLYKSESWTLNIKKLFHKPVKKTIPQTCKKKLFHKPVKKTISQTCEKTISQTCKKTIPQTCKKN